MKLLELTPEKQDQVMDIIEGPLDTEAAAIAVAEVAEVSPGGVRDFIAFTRAQAKAPNAR